MIWRRKRPPPSDLVKNSQQTVGSLELVVAQLEEHVRELREVTAELRLAAARHSDGRDGG